MTTMNALTYVSITLALTQPALGHSDRADDTERNGVWMYRQGHVSQLYLNDLSNKRLLNVQLLKTSKRSP